MGKHRALMAGLMLLSGLSAWAEQPQDTSRSRSKTVRSLNGSRTSGRQTHGAEDVGESQGSSTIQGGSTGASSGFYRAESTSANSSNFVTRTGIVAPPRTVNVPSTVSGITVGSAYTGAPRAGSLTNNIGAGSLVNHIGAGSLVGGPPRAGSLSGVYASEASVKPSPTATPTPTPKPKF